MNFSNILDYIPQRPPFVMVGKIVEVLGEKTVTALTIREDNLFVENGEFFEGGIIENIAQTIAAGAGYRLRENGGEPKMGVIASIRKLQVKERPKAGQTIKTTVELLTDFGSAMEKK